MEDFKSYIAKSVKGKKLKFKCDCLMPLEFIGIIIDYTIDSNEIIFHINSNNKIYKIGLNHPNLKIEELN